MDVNLPAKKSLGQHWLTDQLSLEAIVDMADISSTDLIVEIGPGKGALTSLMTQKAKQVIAIELDSQLAGYLKAMYLPNLTVINEDVLSFNFEELGDYKIVANIPYFITGKIVRLISELQNRPSLVVLLVQKEIASKLAAEPGDLSILGLTAQYFWNIEKGPLVTRDKFDPSPKVDSQVVKLTPKATDLTDQDQQAIFKLIKIGFAAKRKTLLNNLASGYQRDKKSIEDSLKTADISPNRRPQTLSLEEWTKLLSVLG